MYKSEGHAKTKQGGPDNKQESKLRGVQLICPAVHSTISSRRRRGAVQSNRADW